MSVQVACRQLERAHNFLSTPKQLPPPPLSLVQLDLFYSVISFTQGASLLLVNLLSLVTKLPGVQI